MYINDRIIGILAILGGIGIYVGTLGFHAVPGQQFGSAFFPQLLGGALVVCGLALTLGGAHGPLIRFGAMIQGRSGLKVAAVLAGVIGWVLLCPLLGFIATTAVLIAALAALAGGRVLPALATGLGMALILYMIFGRILRVPLPMGPIESLFS